MALVFTSWCYNLMADWWIDESLPIGPFEQPEVSDNVIRVFTEKHKYHTELKQPGQVYVWNGEQMGIIQDVEVIQYSMGGKPNEVRYTVIISSQPVTGWSHPDSDPMADIRDVVDKLLTRSKYS